jgi:peptidoglycan/LPS O-acetylase OafA/YrhL
MTAIDAIQLLRDQLVAILLLAIVIPRSILTDVRAHASLVRPADRPDGAAATAVICALVALAIANDQHTISTHDVAGADHRLWELAGGKLVADIVDGGLLVALAGLAYLLAAPAMALAGDSRSRPSPESDRERRCD